PYTFKQFVEHRSVSLCIAEPTNWVLVVMDQFTRRIIGLGIHRGTVDGPSLCSMFQGAIQGQALPKYLSTTTIRCIGSTNGRPTFECWRYGNQDRTLRATIASLC